MSQKLKMSRFFPLLLFTLLPLVSSHYFEESKYRLEKVSNELESVTFKLNEGCYDHRQQVDQQNRNQNGNGHGNGQRHQNHHSRLCRNSAYSSTMHLLREISHVNILLDNWRNHSACLSYQEEPMVENLIMSFTQGCLDYMGKLNGSAHLNYYDNQKPENNNQQKNSTKNSRVTSTISNSVETLDKLRRAELRRLKSDYERHIYSAHRVRHLLVNDLPLQKIAEKIRFCEAVETNGGIFVGYDQPKEEEYVVDVVRGRQNRGTVAYVLFLKDYSLTDGGPCTWNWKENREVWFHELKSRRVPISSSSSASAPTSKLKVESPRAEFYAIDCSFKMDLCNESLVLPVIHQYQNGTLLQKNYAEYLRNQIKSTMGNSGSGSSSLNFDEAFGFSGHGQGRSATAQAQTSQDEKNQTDAVSSVNKENGLIFFSILIISLFYNIL